VIAPGQTRDIEFIADAPGDWAMHCHRRHHPMNAMGHEIPGKRSRIFSSTPL